jgi:hypothetical protein
MANMKTPFSIMLASGYARPGAHMVDLGPRAREQTGKIRR